MPIPLDLVIYKIVQKCNLDCKYCYVYNRGDDSWKHRPSITSFDVSKQLAKSIKKHCVGFSRESIDIELHGGEPLLIGKRRFQEHIKILRDEAHPIKLNIFLQTNGLLLDSEWIDIFYNHDVRFSVSLDGPPSIADINRIYRSGSGSTIDLLNALLKTRTENPLYEKLCQGYLCVINPKFDGAEVLDWFVSSGFEKFDFLIPDGNYDSPAIATEELHNLTNFLKSAFDRWLTYTKTAPSIRLFEHAITSKIHGNLGSDAFGGDISSLCVVESNGSIGCHDVIRFCRGVYSADELSIYENSLTDHQDYYELEKIQKTAIKCTNCKHFKSCGGGYLPHRFDGKSFDNPSYYCDVLYEFFDHVTLKLEELSPAGFWDREKTKASS